jgi:WD40 repeat protein
MRQSDPSSVMLASSARGAELAVWKITDMLYGQFDQRGCKEDHAEPLFYDDQSFLSPIKAMAWNPNHECVLATGGGDGDQIIRMYDFKKSNEIQHTIRCNSPITSIAWRKTKLRTTL